MKDCEKCRTAFEPKSKRQRFCSDACRQSAYRDSPGYKKRLLEKRRERWKPPQRLARGAEEGGDHGLRREEQRTDQRDERTNETEGLKSEVRANPARRNENGQRDRKSDTVTGRATL